jgi:hypothetical protein
MCWPFTRLRTYSPGTPVHANDLNEFQDAVVYHRHGEIQAPISLGLALPTSGWTYDTVGWVAPASGRTLLVPIPFARATDLLEITAWWNMQNHPFDPADHDDYLGMFIAHTDPYLDAWASTLASPHIADTAVGDHRLERVRYTWNLRTDPVHLQPGRFFRLGVVVGNAGRRVDGIMATIARS